MFKSKESNKFERDSLLESIKLIATDYNQAKLEVEKIISNWSLLILRNC